MRCFLDGALASDVSWLFLNVLHQIAGCIGGVDEALLKRSCFFRFGILGDVSASWLEQARRNAATARLIQTLERRPRFECDDAATDAYELSNLASDPKPNGNVARLRTRLAGWLKQEGDSKALAPFSQ